MNEILMPPGATDSDRTLALMIAMYFDLEELVVCIVGCAMAPRQSRPAR